MGGHRLWATTPKVCSRRGSPRVVRPPPGQPASCQPWPLPGRGRRHQTPHVSARLTGWQPSHACGLEDRQGTAGHLPDPDVPRRGHRARPHATPDVPSFPRGSHPGLCRMAFPRDPRLPLEWVAWVILTCCSPTSRGRTSRMSAAMQTACAWAADDRDARPTDLPVSSRSSSARVHTSTVLTRPGTGALGEPTRRAMGVRWKPVTSSPALLTLALEEVVHVRRHVFSMGAEVHQLSHRRVTIAVSCPRMGLRCRGSTSGPRSDLTLALDVGLQGAGPPPWDTRRGQASTTRLKSLMDAAGAEGRHGPRPWTAPAPGRRGAADTPTPEGASDPRGGIRTRRAWAQTRGTSSDDGRLSS